MSFLPFLSFPMVTKHSISSSCKCTKQKRAIPSYVNAMVEIISKEVNYPEGNTVEKRTFNRK